MSSPPAEHPDPCVICHNPEGRLCVACHCVAYCSKDCQRSDWKSHQKICSQLITQPERPEDGEFKCAIIFKADEDLPRLVWLEVQPTKDSENGEKFRKSSARPIADFLSCTVDALSGLGFQRNVRRERDLDHTLVVNFCNRDCHGINHCVQEVTDYRNFQDFHGSVIVSKFTGFTPEELQCADVEAEDYLDIIDFLITFGDPAYRLQNHLRDSTRFESNFDLPEFRKLEVSPGTPSEDDAQVKKESEEANPPLTPNEKAQVKEEPKEANSPFTPNEENALVKEESKEASSPTTPNEKAQVKEESKEASPPLTPNEYNTQVKEESKEASSPLKPNEENAQVKEEPKEANSPLAPKEDNTQVKEESREASPPLTPKGDERTAKCVRIACAGDVLGGSAKFAEGSLPVSDMTTYSAANVASSQAYYISHISQLVGMPIWLRRVMREHGDRETEFFNPEATLLLTELMNTSSDNWGWPPPYWQAHYGIVGSVVAMREDGEDLTVQQVRDLCEFASMVSRPLTQAALGGDMKLEDCKNLYLTREKMEDFVRMKRLGMQE